MDKKPIDSITPQSILQVLSDGKPRTTFDIAYAIDPILFQDNIAAMRVYSVILFSLNGKVHGSPEKPGMYIIAK